MLKCKLYKNFDITMSTKSVFLNSTSGGWNQATPPPPFWVYQCWGSQYFPHRFVHYSVLYRKNGNLNQICYLLSYGPGNLLVKLPNTVGWCSQHALAADTLTSEWQDSIYSVETTLSIPIEQSTEQERLGPIKLEQMHFSTTPHIITTESVTQTSSFLIV